MPLRRPVQIIVRPVEPETGEPDRPADESASDLDDIAPNSEGAGGTDVDGNTDSTDGEDDD